MKFNCCAKSSAENKSIKDTFLFLRTISDPNRLKIFCILQSGSKCVCEIVESMGISDKLVSHHLKQLKNANLLDEKREGNFIRYSLDRKVLKEYKKIFNKVIK